jgi:hypothetical protein
MAIITTRENSGDFTSEQTNDKHQWQKYSAFRQVILKMWLIPGPAKFSSR